VDEQRAQVFDDEDGAPGNLRTQVFHVDDAVAAQTSALDGKVLCVGNEGAITALGQAQAVDRNARLGGNALVQVCGAALQISGGLVGELLDCAS
jgi:hypothetical protein